MINIYHYLETTIGWLKIDIDVERQQLYEISLVKDIDPHKTLKQKNMEGKKLIQSIESQLQAYLNGERTKFDLNPYLKWLQEEHISSIDKQIGTPFQKQVWRTLLTIPYGSVVSYSDVAEKIQRPKSVRAVANAIGANPVLIVIPCHRVIRKNGQLGGFSAGLDLKQKLICLEKSVIA